MKWFTVPISLALLFGVIPDAQQTFVVTITIHKQHEIHRSIKPLKKSLKNRHSSSKPLSIREVIKKALMLTNEPTSWVKPLLWLAWQESKFHANAVDGKWVRLADRQGDTEHAEGVMQVLPTTFTAHALPGLRDIWQPLDNIVASIRYIAGRYGSPDAIPGIYTSGYNGY